VLRIISSPKGEEVGGDWRKLHNEELYNLFSSSDIIRVIKSRMMKCTGHVGHMGKVRNAYNILDI
jgi:hypothetical protein